MFHHRTNVHNPLKNTNYFGSLKWNICHIIIGIIVFDLVNKRVFIGACKRYKVKKKPIEIL